MRAHEIRQLDDQELQKELEDSRKELLNLRFRVATKQLANTAQIRTARKNIARLITVVRERQAGVR
jgi:large subunit ribosomal protein L29